MRMLAGLVAAQEAGLSGLSFLRGIPGSIGGALRMNGGAYGREVKDALVEARAVDRAGKVHHLRNADMGFSYRHCAVPDDYVFTQALFRAARGDPAVIAAEMDKITEAREATQPEMHCNFLINLGKATAADIETLGETVRQRVNESSGVALEWEIKRIGVAK